MALSGEADGREAMAPATGASSRTSWWSGGDLLAVLLFLLILGRCSQELRIGCPDFFWHVKTGERIVHERRVIWRDDFSHTSRGNVRPPHDWLFQVGEYLVYSRFGMDGVIVATGILAGAGVVLLYWMLRHSLGLPALLAVALAWAFWGVWAGSVTLLRPKTLGPLGLLVVLWAATNWRRGRPRMMLWLPLLYVLWASLHGSFVYGIAVSLAFLATEAARTWVLRRGRPVRDGEARGRLRMLSLCTGACVVATFVSPAHYHTYHNAAKFIVWQMEWTPQITEWQPWQIDAHGVGGFIVVALVASLCLGRRPVSVFWTALLAGTFWYALFHRRFVPMFAVTALPLVGVQLQSWLAHLEETVPLLGPAARWRQWLQGTILAPGLTRTRLYPVVVCAVTAGAAVLVWPLLPRGRTIETCTNPGDYPFAIADTVRRYDVPGKMLNEYGDGGFLIFRLWPRQRVFVDGRDRMHGDRVCLDASDAISGRENWRELLEQYGVTFVIANEGSGVVPKLDADGEWVLAQRAEKHRFYLKRCRLNEAVVERLRADGIIRRAPLAPGGQASPGGRGGLS
jgi:hypothetical protein